VGDFWTDTGGSGGNQLFVWQGDYFVSASGYAEQVTTTSDVQLTNPTIRGMTTQEDANFNINERLDALETEIVAGNYQTVRDNL
jgi:hypothetical protein